MTRGPRRAALRCAALLLLGAPLRAQEPAWRPLFDGKSLVGWSVSRFGGEGGVRVDSGRIELEMGNSMTGIAWAGEELPRVDYEIAVEAIKLDGNDFFCGLTFPVGDAFCSFIVGGWGGGVVGLSSLDGMDASENETSRVMSFDRNRWYRIRVRVRRSKIEAWIDDERVVDAEVSGRRISIRPEVDLSRPLGIATWLTRAALRDIKLRKLP
jgi:hypothetical protein